MNFGATLLNVRLHGLFDQGRSKGFAEAAAVRLELAMACAQVGHLKTVIILAGGFLIFNEAMPPKKLAGVALSLTGIVWYLARLLLHPGSAQTGPLRP